MHETINETRRRMLTVTAMTTVGSQFTRAIAADTPAGSAKSSFGPLKQVDAGLLNMGYAEAGPAGGRPVMAIRHLQLRRRRTFACVGGLPGDCAVCARLRHDTLSFDGNVPEWPTVRGGLGCHRAHGCSRDQDRSPRRVRLGSAEREHCRGAL